MGSTQESWEPLHYTACCHNNQTFIFATIIKPLFLFSCQIKGNDDYLTSKLLAGRRNALHVGIFSNFYLFLLKLETPPDQKQLADAYS